MSFTGCLSKVGCQLAISRASRRWLANGQFAHEIRRVVSDAKTNPRRQSPPRWGRVRAEPLNNAWRWDSCWVEPRIRKSVRQSLMKTGQPQLIRASRQMVSCARSRVARSDAKIITGEAVSAKWLRSVFTWRARST